MYCGPGSLSRGAVSVRPTGARIPDGKTRSLHVQQAVDAAGWSREKDRPSGGAGEQAEAWPPVRDPGNA